MREHLGFLKTSSVVVKIAAWVFLLFGLIGGTSIILGLTPASPYPRWGGIVVLVIYSFFFFFFYLIAKIADLLIKIINEIKKQ
jgi:hypothetical protein